MLSIGSPINLFRVSDLFERFKDPVGNLILSSSYIFSIPQSLILSRAYPFEIIWTEAIFNQFVVQGKDYYIIEYCVRMELTDSMVEHLVKSFQSQSNITPKMETAISIIVQTTQSVILRYRLASLLSDKGIIARLINGDCLYFLKDSNYGCNEIL